MDKGNCGISGGVVIQVEKGAVLVERRGRVEGGKIPYLCKKRKKRVNGS